MAEDYLTRKYRSSEFVTTVASGVVFAIFCLLVPVKHAVIALSIAMNGYLIARTVFKIDRSLVHPGFTTLEFKCHLLTQALVIFGGVLDHSCLITSIYVYAINQFIYSVCRNFVKSQIRKTNVKVNNINI